MFASYKVFHVSKFNICEKIKGFEYVNLGFRDNDAHVFYFLALYSLNTKKRNKKITQNC